MIKKYIKLTFVIIFIFTTNYLFAQNEQTKQDIIENYVQQLAENSDEELDYTTLFDDLMYYINNPLNLNEASYADLMKLQILTPYQILNILNYRKRNKQFVSIYELQLVKGINKEQIYSILPFITVGKTKEKQKFKFKNMVKYGSNQVFMRYQQVLEQQKGYLPITDSALAANPNSRYLGSPQKYYFRYKFHYKKKIFWGFTGEKDPGEEFFKGSQKQGFDFSSAHLQINDIGPVKKIILGDFQAQFGQGLTMWSGMGFGKSSFTTNILKIPRGIRKYSSTNENLFMRGGGATVRFKNLDFTAFVSKKKIDANISVFDTLDNDVREVTSFQSTGYHRTPNELADKHAISEFIAGGDLTYNTRYFKTGLTFVNFKYDADLNKNIQPYNQFDFMGNQNFNVGINYLFTYKGINFFGEEAMSQNKSMAFVNGASFQLIPQVSLAVLHRNYNKSYNALYANGFAESKTQNEKGFYLGAEIFPVKYWKISAYYDSYSFNWLKFLTNAPSTGIDYFVQADYDASHNVKMYFKFKQEIKQKNKTTDAVAINPVEDYSNLKFRYNINFTVSKSLTLKSRIEISNYTIGNNNPEKGYLVYQDIIYQFPKLPMRVSLRYAIFDTDTYNARIYAYENDVLYAFSIPAYYSKGIRTYALIKYKLTKNIDMWLRYAITKFADKDLIGSNLDEIQGSTKSEVKVQFKFKF